MASAARDNSEVHVVSIASNLVAAKCQHIHVDTQLFSGVAFRTNCCHSVVIIIHLVAATHFIAGLFKCECWQWRDVGLVVRIRRLNELTNYWKPQLEVLGTPQIGVCFTSSRAFSRKYK